MTKTNKAPAAYAGKALVKQDPQGKPLTVAGQMRAANEGISLALKRMADLMSGDMPLPALTGAYFLMRREWNPVLKRLDDAANKALKAEVTEKGELSRGDGGGEVHTMDVDFSGAKFRCVASQALATTPDVKELCALAGLKESQLTVQVISHEFSQDKLDKLMAEGRVTQEQIDKCRKARSVSLKVEKL